MRDYEKIALDPSDHELKIETFPGDLERFEDISTAVSGRFEDGQHFMLLESVGVMKGRSTPDGYYVQGNLAGHQTMLVVAPPAAYSEPMTDNNFIRKGWLPNEHLHVEDLHVTEDAGTVTWAIGQREHTFRHDEDGTLVVHSGGESYVDVVLDLTHRQRGDVVRWGNPRWGTDDALKMNRAAYHAIADVTGSITIEGRKHDVARGVSVIEHYSMCEPLSVAGSVPASQTEGWYWAVGGTPEFMVYAVASPDNMVEANDAMGMQVVIDGRSIDLRAIDGNTIKFPSCRWWHDLRSGLQVPYAWQAVAAGPQGTLVLSLEGFHRGYYAYAYNNGTATVTWTICRISGGFHFPDGRFVAMPEHATMAVESAQRTYSVEETLHGPIADLRSRT